MNKVRALYNYFFVPSAIELATSALRKATIARIEAEQGRDWSLAMLEYQGKREAALREFLATATALAAPADPTPPAPAPSAPAVVVSITAAPTARRRSSAMASPVEA